VYQGKIKYIGEGVAVPSHVYKVIIDKQRQQGIAYLVPNRGPKKGERYDDYRVTIKAVEDVTGINFTPQFPNAFFKHVIGSEFK
jgi:endonuclease G